jgi:hypothetical protein
MKALGLITIMSLVALTGCYAVPVSDTYVADCYDCDGTFPPTRTYSHAYVYDYWTPLALVSGLAIGYALGDNHGYSHYGHGHRGWYGYRGHYYGH